MENPSQLVDSHIARLFGPEDRDEVRRLLREDCGTALLGSQRASPQLAERIQCAALRLSDGRLDKLYDAIALAQTDWRDLLVAAGFAERTDAHKDWMG